jgi:hypothetical protein
MRVVASQVGAVALRSVTRTARQPASAIPPILFPVSLMLVNAAGLDASTRLPGFPTDSFLAFALAVPFIQGALFSTMNAGTDLARDIQTGFLNRLSLTPLRGSALLAGQLGGIVVLGVLAAVVYIVVGLIAATLNPVSYLIECVRSLVITGWDTRALVLGFGLAGAIGVVSTALASWALRERLART